MAEMTGGVADRMGAGPRSWRGWLMDWNLWLRWVLDSTVGWVVRGPVGGSVGVGFAVFGVVYGVLNGRVLVGLLRQPVPAAATANP